MRPNIFPCGKFHIKMQMDNLILYWMYHPFLSLILELCCLFLSCRTLRPYPISSKRIVPAHIDKPDWASDVS